MSESKQRFLLWWSLALIVIYGFALVFLLKMFPPPSPSWSDLRVQEFYQDNSLSIRIGAVLAGWTGAFLVPFFIVMALQAARTEKGAPVWGILLGIGGSVQSILLVLPPIFWGVAAFDAGRSADVTALMHQLGCLTLVATDQYFIFPWVAVIFICFLKTDAAHSPFPRWFGYFSAWAMLMFEAGAVSFLPKSGVFAWNGLLPFWIPFTVFGAWMTIAYVLMFRALKNQGADALKSGAKLSPAEPHEQAGAEAEPAGLPVP